MMFDSRSWPSVAVAGGDAAFAEFGQHGGVVDAQVLADSRQGPAKVVEVDGVVDLLGGESAAAHRYVVSFEELLTVRRSMPNRSPSSYTVAPAW